VADRFLTSSGSSIYFDDNGAGIPVVAIHGLGGGAYFFRGLAARLQGHCRLRALDLPGTGRSTSGPRPMSAESWVQDIGEFLERVVAEPAVILGHSLGTILALKGWEAWPQCVRALVFVGGLPEVRPLIRERLAQRIEPVTRDGLAGWGERVSPGVFSPATLVSQPETVGLFERLLESQDAGAYVRTMQILLATSATALVPTVRVPSIAITGEDDQYAPVEYVKAFVRHLPDRSSVAIIPACGHLPFLEAPDVFAVFVRAFLDTL